MPPNPLKCHIQQNSQRTHLNNKMKNPSELHLGAVVAEFGCGLVVQTGEVKSDPRLDEDATTDVTNILVEAFL